MRLGIGGGIGPIRGGVSTRGFGIGVGPFSAGSSTSGCATALGAMLALGAVLLVFFWPLLLGDWLAQQFGEKPESTAGQILGWSFEGLYGLAVILGWYAVRRRRLHTAKVCAVQGLLDHAQRSQREAQIALEALAEGKTLIRIHGVALIEPRVRERGGPKVPTQVDSGVLSITPDEIEFSGQSKRATWPPARLERVVDKGDHVALHVSRRKTISGISTPGRSPGVVGALIV